MFSLSVTEISVKEEALVALFLFSTKRLSADLQRSGKFRSAAPTVAPGQFPERRSEIRSELFSGAPLRQSLRPLERRSDNRSENRSEKQRLQILVKDVKS